MFIILFLYNEYIVCLISFVRSIELFPAFNWPINIGNLVINWLGVYTFIPDPVWSESESDKEISNDFA